jgi:antitoxin CptB
MYNTLVMSNKLEIFKKKLIYRSSYRGTKEMDILLSSFVNKYINELEEESLYELEKFLNFEDEIILNFYNQNIIEKKIDENKVSKLFKTHKI